MHNTRKPALTLGLVVFLALVALLFGGISCLQQAPVVDEPAPISALDAKDSRRVDLHAATATTSTGTAAPCEGYNTGVIQVVLSSSPAASLTVTFQGTVDGSNWVAVRATNLNSGSAATTSTAAGLYSIATSGLSQVRANVTTFVTGTITAEILLVK